MSDAPNPSVAPPPLTVAASLVAVEGFVLIALGIALIADLDPDRWSLGVSTAAFFAVYGALLLVAAYGLWRRTAWSRGPAMITQLIMLGIAWSLREQPLVAVCIAVVALVAIVGMVHPSSIEALSGEDR
ncbi:hypothetical protein [Nocardioides sp. MH1]|uniref:hypothetical protein n=1 Tax=Nocardioides sp. MH1 TaxID=3242490 RepID=UPI00351FE3A0